MDACLNLKRTPEQFFHSQIRPALQAVVVARGAYTNPTPKRLYMPHLHSEISKSLRDPDSTLRFPHFELLQLCVSETVYAYPQK